MITPSHLIYSWAVAKSTETTTPPAEQRHRTLAFILGALLPDTPVYIFFIVNGLILGYSHERLWDDMYFNSDWSILFTLSHSLLLWPLLALFGHLLKIKLLVPLALSALLHIGVDFLVHTEDAYKHFWPLTDWRFVSPVSYWNRAEYGQYVGVLDSLLILGLLTYLFTRYQTTWFRLFISVLGTLYTIRLFAEVIIA